MNIGQLATTPAVTCRPEASIATVAREMRETGTGCVVVVDDDQRAVGILTDRDIVVRALAADWDAHAPVRSVMTEAVLTLASDLDVLRAGELMGSWACRRVPVVDAQDCVIGVVSFDDVALLLVDEAEHVFRVLGAARASTRSGRA